MNRICFVSVGNIYITPYINQYTRIIKGSYDLIYWDREGIEESVDDEGVCLIRFEKKISGKLSKLFSYLRFRRFLIKKLKQKKYDYVILLSTIGALLLGGFLVRYYKGKFIIDVRDYTYEKNPIIYSIEKRTFKHAYKCVISSEGYKAFLPPNIDYMVVHNIRHLDCSTVERIRNRNKEKTILNISYIGFVNYQDQFKKLLLHLKNDSRFFLSFIGTRALELKSFCEANGIKNVVLADRFSPKEILNYYEEADIVNNLYGNHTPVLDYALSNKLYFAAALGMPILTCDGTFMSKVSHKYEFGIDVDLDSEDVADHIFNSYSRINWDNLLNKTSLFLNEVERQQKEFYEMLFSIK